MGQLFADAARAYLSAGINNTDTTISIAAGGALFPVANGTDWFKAVLQDANGIEIVYVTAHTSASTSFTVTRGQEGTTARSFAAGAVFGIRVTSADMVGFAAKLSDAPSDGKQYARKDATWAEVVAGDVTQTGTQTLSNKTLSGAVLNDGYTEEVFAVTGTAPALSPTNGSIQTWTLTGNATPTEGTWASGQSMTLMVDDDSAYTINWASMSITWKTGGGTAPALLTTDYTPIELTKIGTTIYGWLAGGA